jgi:outer membrane receptor protein involved in Fe transport
MKLSSTASAGAAPRPLVTLCLLGGLAAGGGLSPLATHAQQPPNTPSATTAAPGDAALDAVVVSASREGGSRRKTPAAIDVITERAIEAKRPTFIGEVLNQAAGVYMPDLRNEQHMMSIRHPLTTGAAYLYMEDGLPLRPPGLFNHNALYELNLEGIDRIEVLRGPASSLYGSNAVGGAVNFFTRSALKPARHVLGGQLSDQGFARLDFGTSTGPMGSDERQQGLSLSGYVSRQRGGDADYNDADKHSVKLRHDWAWSATTRLKTTLTSNLLDTDMPGGLTPQQYQRDPGFSANTFTYRKVRATRLSSTLEGEWNPGGLTALTLFARDNVTDQLPSFRITTDRFNVTTGFITNQSFQSAGLDARHRQDITTPWGKLRWINGAQFDHSPMQADETRLSITRNAQDVNVSFVPTGVVRDYEVVVDNRALYTQLEWVPTPSVQVVGGLRHDDIRYDYTNRLTPSATTGAPSEERRYRQLSPKLGATWQALPGLTFFGNLSRGFTPPEVSSQYGSRLSSPDLTSSTFDNVDLGVRWAEPKHARRLELALYQLDGRDEVLNYTNPQGESAPRNAGRTQHTGLEFAASQRWGAWSMGLAGSWSRHTYRDFRVSNSLDYSGRDMKAAPRWLANLELGWQATPQWRLSGVVQHLDAYWMNDANTVRYPGHTLLNLQARWQQGPWEAWLKVNNALNQRHAEQANSRYIGTGSYSPATQDTYSPGALRTVFVGLRYTWATRAGGL